jgi:hypothetical protein
MAYVTPKIDWTSDNAVADTDLNRIEANIKYLKEQHADQTTNIHGAVSAATASKIIIRDAAGRAKVYKGAVSDDIATVENVSDEAAGRTAADNSLQSAIDAIEAGYLPLAGGTMTGGAIGHVGTDYTTGRFRNVFLSTAAPGPADGNNGDVWMLYEI